PGPAGAGGGSGSPPPPRNSRVASTMMTSRIATWIRRFSRRLRSRAAIGDSYANCPVPSPAVVVERVAGGADGPDQLRSAADIDRLAEPADVDIDGAELDVAVAAPDGIEQPHPAEHPARMFEEMAQQPELGRTERDRLARAL